MELDGAVLYSYENSLAKNSTRSILSHFEILQIPQHLSFCQGASVRPLRVIAWGSPLRLALHPLEAFRALDGFCRELLIRQPPSKSHGSQSPAGLRGSHCVLTAQTAARPGGGALSPWNRPGSSLWPRVPTGREARPLRSGPPFPAQACTGVRRGSPIPTASSRALSDPCPVNLVHPNPSRCLLPRGPERTPHAFLHRLPLWSPVDKSHHGLGRRALLRPRLASPAPRLPEPAGVT